MDPNANLSAQLRVAKRVIDPEHPVSEDDARCLADLVIALDEWIRRGGFLPAPWTAEPTVVHGAAAAMEEAEEAIFTGAADQYHSDTLHEAVKRLTTKPE